MLDNLHKVIFASPEERHTEMMPGVLTSWPLYRESSLYRESANLWFQDYVSRDVDGISFHPPLTTFWENGNTPSVICKLKVVIAAYGLVISLKIK